MDYALTIDCAKQIAMLQRNAQGQQVRAYFIKCEELLKEKLKKQELVLPKDYPSALRALADAEEEKMKALEIAKENELKVTSISSLTITRSISMMIAYMRMMRPLTT